MQSSEQGAPAFRHNDEDARLIARIVERCGPSAVVSPADTATRSLNLRGERMAAVPLLRPASTEEVAFVVSASRTAGRSLVPVGGASGLVDALKQSTGREWYISFERMRRIERIDAETAASPSLMLASSSKVCRMLRQCGGCCLRSILEPAARQRSAG